MKIEIKEWKENMTTEEKRKTTLLNCSKLIGLLFRQIMTLGTLEETDLIEELKED